MLDQDNNFYLISMSILVTCSLENVWLLKGKFFKLITSES